MTVLAQDIIKRAYREVNIVALGTSPTDDQNQEGLDRLNAWLRIMFGSEMGEPLQDWLVPSPQRTAPVAANFPQLPYPQGTDWNLMGTPLPGSVGPTLWPYPPGNSRLIVGLTQNTTVWFPEQPYDGARMAIIGSGLTVGGPAFTLTLDGNSRTINGAKLFTITTPILSTQRMRWMYRADLGDWRPMASLALTDPLPFPDDMEDYLALGLAIRIAPGSDKTISAETLKAYRSADTIFQARYKQGGPTTYGAQDVPTSYESFLGGRYWW